MSYVAMECPYCHEHVAPIKGSYGRLRCPECLNTGHVETSSRGPMFVEVGAPRPPP